MSLFDKTNKVTPASVSSQLLASGDPSGTWASSKGHAVWIRPSSPLIGKTIDSITWTLKNANGTTGSLDFGVWGSYGNTSPVQSFGSISESTLTTSFADYTLTFTPYTIQEGDYIGFRTSSDGINSMVTASASVPSVYTDYHASTWWNNGLGGAYGWDTYPNTGGGNLSSSNNTNSVAFGISRKFMGQRVVENFSGSVLDTDRWDQSNTNGTQAMADSVDGGLLMSTTSSGSSISYIDFADKKQFSNTGSVMIAVMKHGSTTGGESYTGLQSGTTQGNGQGAWSYVNDAWKGAVFNFYTVGASGGTWVQTGCVTSDTNWHIHKIELTSSAGSLQIDGNTTVTSTTNLPAVSLQPSVGINNTSAVNRTLNIRYMECFNT